MIRMASINRAVSSRGSFLLSFSKYRSKVRDSPFYRIPFTFNGVRTANTTVIQPLYAISRRGVVFVQKIIQPCNITVEPVELVRIANTLHASIVLEAMQRTIKNVTNSKSYCRNSIEIALEPTSRTYQIP
jgi:hypothetical protein